MATNILKKGERLIQFENDEIIETAHYNKMEGKTAVHYYIILFFACSRLGVLYYWKA